MNRNRRKRLTEIGVRIEDLKADIEVLMAEEQEAFDNMPESLQQSCKGEAMEAVVELLDDALSDLDTVLAGLEEAKS